MTKVPAPQVCRDGVFRWLQLQQVQQQRMQQQQLHSTATVFIAFIKPTISKITIPYSILEETDEITLNKIGSKAFIVFSSLIILMHNGILFGLEHLHFNHQIAGKIIASSLVTLILVLILEIFKFSKK